MGNTGKNMRITPKRRFRKPGKKNQGRYQVVLWAGQVCFQKIDFFYTFICRLPGLQCRQQNGKDYKNEPQYQQSICQQHIIPRVS